MIRLPAGTEDSFVAGPVDQHPAAAVAVIEEILDAAIDLLVDGGMEALTFQNVAERAVVSRATMYRRWPSPTHLAAEAIRTRANASIRVPDLGSLSMDLSDVLRQIGLFIDTPVGRASLAASLDIGPVDVGAPNWGERWDQVQPIVDRAVERGELEPGVDGEATFAALAGAMYFRVLVTGRSVDDGWIERVLAANLPGSRDGRDQRSR